MKINITRTIFVVLSLTMLCLSANEFSLVTQSAPTARTGFATNVAPTSVTFNGYVNPNGFETWVKFISCSAPGSASYFNETPEQNIGAGMSEVPVSYALTGLTPGLPYSFQVVARVGAGVVAGSCTTFSTPAQPPSTLGPPPTAPPGVIGAPTVQTLQATNVSQTGATLNGNVNPNSLDTTVDFVSCDPSGSASYFYHTPTQILSGTQTQLMWSQLSGLKPGTTYKYAVRATNSAGTQVGSCLTFTTGSGAGQTVPPLPGVIGAPTVQTLPATNISGTSARLNATVNPNSLPTKVDFVSCDPTSSPGYFSPTAFQNVSGTLTITVSLTLMGLKPGVAYNYRARAANGAGTELGNCVMFVTPSTQTTPTTTPPATTSSPAATSAPPATTSAPAQSPVSPSNRPPKANAGSDKNVVLGNVVSLDGSASFDPDGNVLTYIWDFGDGTTGAGQKSRHSYSKAGQYAVSLTVSDGQYSDTAYVTVFVSEKSGGFSLGGNMLLYVGLGLIALLLLIIIIVLLVRK